MMIYPRQIRKYCYQGISFITAGFFFAFSLITVVASSTPAQAAQAQASYEAQLSCSLTSLFTSSNASEEEVLASIGQVFGRNFMPSALTYVETEGSTAFGKLLNETTLLCSDAAVQMRAKAGSGDVVVHLPILIYIVIAVVYASKLLPPSLVNQQFARIGVKVTPSHEEGTNK